MENNCPLAPRINCSLKDVLEYFTYIDRCIERVRVHKTFTSIHSFHIPNNAIFINISLLMHLFVRSTPSIELQTSGNFSSPYASLFLVLPGVNMNFSFRTQTLGQFYPSRCFRLASWTSFVGGHFIFGVDVVEVVFVVVIFVGLMFYCFSSCLLCSRSCFCCSWFSSCSGNSCFQRNRLFCWPVHWFVL